MPVKQVGNSFINFIILILCSAGWCLIFISIILAYYLEKTFLMVRNLLANWSRLLGFLGLFYTLNLIIILWLHIKSTPIDNVIIFTNY
jgi:hypothetical protein